MKYQIKKMIKGYLRIRESGNNNIGTWLDIEIPEEVYEEIKNKLHGKPYTGIHGKIFSLNRAQSLPSEVVLDYLYNNGFDYLFEE